MKTRTNHGNEIEVGNLPEVCNHRSYIGETLIVDKGFVLSDLECTRCGENFGEFGPGEEPAVGSFQH